MALEFEQLAPRNRCAASVIALASLAERIALAERQHSNAARTFRDWQAVLDYMKAHTQPFKSSGQDRWPSDFLNLRGSPISITQRNPNSMPRLEDGLIKILEAYLRSGGPLSQAEGTNRKRRPTFLLRAIEGLRELCMPEAFQTIVKKIEHTPFTNSTLQQLITYLTANTAVPPHPILGTLSLLDPLVIQSEFFGVRVRPGLPTDDRARIARASSGIYAVLREARGWSAPDFNDMNMIVRDLLWLREPMPGNDDGAESGEVILGLYVSAIDDDCFIIERVDIQRPNIILTGRASKFENSEQRITLIFTAGPTSHDFQVRDGILSGLAEEGRSLGAWKAILIRPHWELTAQLSTIFHQIPFERIEQIIALCKYLRIVGLCFSDNLYAQNSALQARKIAFRSLIAEGTAAAERGANLFKSTELMRRFQDTVRDWYDYSSTATINSDHKISALMIDVEKLLDIYITDNWKFIEPVQIMTFGKRRITRDLGEMHVQSIEFVKALLDTSDISVDLTAMHL